MDPLSRLLRDRERFERRVLAPLCTLGSAVLLGVLLLHRLGVLK